MQFIIPAKSKSTRVPNKNWRPFYGQFCLVELAIQKLLKATVPPELIWISCDNPNRCSEICKNYGVNYLKRPDYLTHNQVPLTRWIREITSEFPNSDIAWCQVCDPLFDDYAKCLSIWLEVKESGYDSLVVSHPWKGYLMTADHQPIGWSFGEHHTPSQNLPQFRLMPFTLSLLTQEAIHSTSYHIGRRPYWYDTSQSTIDIDTEEDFAAARELYSYQQLQKAL